MASRDTPITSNTPALVVAWLFVGIPLLWGVLDTLRNAIKLFQ
ncbi:MAG TPA: hypothetical protein VFB22_09535 [Candidatus Baltobacteraceae bacterium]|nr:hypothetical protein [Candidatus Baltobacteraceae bacterium]